MANVQVRNVDEDIVTRLKLRAGERGQSLQGYLLDLLAAEAAVVSNDALLEAA
jgi:plasmid stability protein